MVYNKILSIATPKVEANSNQKLNPFNRHVSRFAIIQLLVLSLLIINPSP